MSHDLIFVSNSLDLLMMARAPWETSRSVNFHDRRSVSSLVMLKLSNWLIVIGGGFFILLLAISAM